MSSNLNVTVSLDPIWERFDAVDANAAILTDRIKRLEERARAEDDGTREALAMATERVQELERQLKAHHDNDAQLQQQLEVIAHAIAPIREATDDPIMPIGQRVRVAIDTLSLRAGALQGELQGMHQREREVDKVVAAWDNGSLKGYDGTIDPETPAGRVVELLRDLTKVRPNTTPSIKANRAALDAIYAELGEYGLLQGNDGDYAEGIVTATRAALADRADARQQLEGIERTIASIPAGDPAEGRTVADRVYAAFTALTDPARQDTGEDIPEGTSLFMPAGQARQHAHTIKVALDMYDRGTDPLASLTLHHPLDLSGRVAALASHALRLQSDSGAAAAARIRAYLYDTSSVATHDSANDALALEWFLAGLARAAQIAADETPEADPNVAHIDTVNGRQRAAQAPDTTETE